MPPVTVWDMGLGHGYLDFEDPRVPRWPKAQVPLKWKDDMKNNT